MTRLQKSRNSTIQDPLLDSRDTSSGFPHEARAYGNKPEGLSRLSQEEPELVGNRPEPAPKTCPYLGVCPEPDPGTAGNQPPRPSSRIWQACESSTGVMEIITTEETTP